MEHRRIYSILLILLIRTRRQIDVKGFVQSHQLLCDKLGTRTQIFNIFSTTESSAEGLVHHKRCSLMVSVQKLTREVDQ